MTREDEKFNATLKELMDAAKQPEGARNALAMLFPKVDAALDTYVPSDQIDGFARTKERRIAEAEFAPMYFRLDATPVSWSRSELKQIIDLGPKRALELVEERATKFSDEDSAHLRRLFLDFLTSWFIEGDRFNSDWLLNLITVSSTYIKQASGRPRDLFEDDGFVPFNRLFFQALRPLTPDRRYHIITERLDQIDDLSVLVDFFRATVGDEHPNGARSEGEKLFFGDRTQELRDRLVEKVRVLARSGELWGQVSPDRLLWFWWGSNHEQEVRDFLAQAIRDPATLRQVLKIVIGKVVSSSGNFERVSRSYSRLVDFDELTVAAENLSKSSKEDASLVDRYMQALKRSESSSF
jgi:hypothetical protein